MVRIYVFTVISYYTANILSLTIPIIQEEVIVWPLVISNHVAYETPHLLLRIKLNVGRKERLNQPCAGSV
jgi:hypothetical protein